MVHSISGARQKVGIAIILALLCISGFFCLGSTQAQAATTNQVQIEELTKLLQTLQALLAQLVGENVSTSPQEGGFNDRAISVGSMVHTTDVLKVRNTPSTAARLVGTKQSYVNGKVTDGPRSSNGYTWWYVEFSDNSIDGWVAGNWLRIIENLTLPGISKTAIVTSISNSENPTVKGTAQNGTALTFSVGGPSGDKVYSSGSISIFDGRWSHKIATDLQDGIHTLVLYNGNIEVSRKNFTIDLNVPSCKLTTDKSVYEYNDDIKVSWTSANATYVTFVPDISGKDTIPVSAEKEPTSGSLHFDATVLGLPKFTLKAVAADGRSSICSTTVEITD